MFDYRMEADPNAYSIMNLFVDRIRRAPKCFGMHIYTPGEAQTLMCSFHFLDSLVSWLALNDMLTVHVVHKPTKRSAKLHFLTRESRQIKELLTRYSDAVLQELQRVDKERALREKASDKKLDA